VCIIPSTNIALLITRVIRVIAIVQSVSLVQSGRIVERIILGVVPLLRRAVSADDD
jgi:hypothetical protein